MWPRRKEGRNKRSVRCQRWWATSSKCCRTFADNGHQSFVLRVVFRLRSHHPLGPQPCEPDGNKQLNILLCLLNSQNSLWCSDRSTRDERAAAFISKKDISGTESVDLVQMRGRLRGKCMMIDEPTCESARSTYTNTHTHFQNAWVILLCHLILHKSNFNIFLLIFICISH